MELYFVADFSTNDHCYMKDLKKHTNKNGGCLIICDGKRDDPNAICEIAPLFTDKSNIKKVSKYLFTPDIEKRIKSIEVNDPDIINAVKENERIEMIADEFFSNPFNFFKKYGKENI